MAKKGIKRHESLYPLSHRHHHGLFLALKLRKAGTENSKFTIEQLREELVDFWDQGGNQHFRDEDEILLPTFALYASVDVPEIKEALQEHVIIRSLVQKIRLNEENLEPIMQKLGQLLDDHIRKEERIIFPLIEKALPEDVLRELAKQFH